jgi:hypothetical protein
MKSIRLKNIVLFFFFFRDGATTHLLQAENKDDYESWLIALKRTAYSRVGGGELIS